MTKNNFNLLLRDYVENNLSPTQAEHDLISNIYSSIQNALEQKCIKIGSYPRLTSIKPVHDLDVLYITGRLSIENARPREVLSDLNNKIETEFENNTPYEANVLMQTHSISIIFTDSDGKEVISVDIVPAFISGGINEFGDNTYWVPELIEISHAKRMKYYEKSLIAKTNEADWWIKTDPQGYIRLTENMNKMNSDFLSTVKFIKKWKYNFGEKYSDSDLKSFHLEQVVISIFKNNTNMEMFDAIFSFFTKLPDIIANPNTILDRADNSKFIDDYLETFTDEQKKKIKQARDGFLIKLEELDEVDNLANLMEISPYERKSINEEFLFDQKIPVLREKTLTINGWIQKDNQNFRRLNQLGIIDRDLQIKFDVHMPIECDLYKWKVKNDDGSIQPRGEITNHYTRNHPERTQYKGSHYVECYAILNNICIALARQNVVILH